MVLRRQDSWCHGLTGQSVGKYTLVKRR